jgi:peptide/nickel transport system permease protein
MPRAGLAGMNVQEYGSRAPAHQPMLTYLARRLVFAAVLVAVVSASALMLTRLAPGDILSEQVGTGVSGRVLEAERARLGLDRPILDQAAEWAARAVRFDFGTSLMYGRPVGGLVVERARNTAALALVSLLLATLLGIPAGVVTGSRSGAAVWAVRAASVAALSLPPLVMSLLLVFVAARTGWLPTGGMSAPAAASGWLGAMADLAWHLVVPACAIAIPLAATIERLQSQATAEVMGEVYVRAAAARGVPPGRLVWRHALKPALRPVASVYGLIFGSLLSGSFVVEIVTAWPGLGRLMFDALRSRDVYLVAGCAAAGGAFLAAGALLSDMLLVIVDPRLRGRMEAGS